MLKQYPKNIKFKKNHKVNKNFLYLYDTKTAVPEFGNIGLQSLKAGKLTYKQLEASRRTLKRNVKKIGFFWIKVSVTRPVTKKPLGTRMGKGKGMTSFWIAPVRKGQLIFEIAGIPLDKAYLILKKAQSKLSIKTKIIYLRY